MHIVDQLPEAVLIVSEFPHEIKFLNKQVETLFSILDPTELSYSTLINKFPQLKDPFYSNNDKQEIRQNKAQFLAKQQYLSFESALNLFFNLDSHENNTYLFEMNNEMIFEIKFTNSEFDQKHCALITCENITLRFKHEINEYKTKVLSSFSHELRTPLNGAICPLQIAMCDSRIPEEVKSESIENSLLSLFLLENSLNDIVDLSLLLTDQFKLTNNEFLVTEFIEEIKYIIKKPLEAKLIILTVKIKENIPEVCRSDCKRLKQIILNLMTNAIKFTSQGGSIILGVSYNFNDTKLSFKIKDNGIGISQERLHKLQQLLKKPEFVTSSRIMKSINSTSCCLGLIISQNLALRLGGKESTGISVKSLQNVGSIFKFSIQTQKKLILKSFQDFQSLNSESSFKSSKENVQQLPMFQTKQLTEQHLNVKIPMRNYEKYILLVDDDCFNLLALELLLTKLNKKCIKAYNGQEAVSQLLQIYNNPDNTKQVSLILMDYQMPVMNGVEAAKQISELIKTSIIPEIPIAACTAYASKEQIKQCYEAGMIDYLIKPISTNALLNVLKKWTFYI